MQQFWRHGPLGIDVDFQQSLIEFFMREHVAYLPIHGDNYIAIIEPIKNEFILFFNASGNQFTEYCFEILHGNLITAFERIFECI